MRSDNSFRQVSIIATRSPVLLSTDHLKSELNFNSAVKNDQFSPVRIKKNFL